MWSKGGRVWEGVKKQFGTCLCTGYFRTHLDLIQLVFDVCLHPIERFPYTARRTPSSQGQDSWLCQHCVVFEGWPTAVAAPAWGATSRYWRYNGISEQMSEHDADKHCVQKGYRMLSRPS